MAINIEKPYYPIIYVRGYAGSEDAVEETVATPYMGFNLGSTKMRQRWTGKLERHIFESPLVRLMKDYGYRDVYHGGDTIPEDRQIPARSVIIYRYYDQVSKELGEGTKPDIPVYAKGLGELIQRVRKQVCMDDAGAVEKFRVYLVAHSMGGLIVRCFLQNPPPGTPDMRPCVDKVFTYATPHNGIAMRVIGNVPGFFTRNNVNNFNRKYMAEYLGLSEGVERVDDLNGKFNTDRFFTLIGTNYKDYTVASGWSRRVVGPISDGLVRIDNASVKGSPRALVHRSHSGHYGIVNSESGYQNLSRFLFGDLRVDGLLRIHDITLPPEIEREKKRGKKIDASYHIEVIVRPRGARYELTRRVTGEGSAIFRKYDELFAPGAARHPVLFSTYLSARHRSRARGALVFSVDLRVRVPEYEIGGRIFDHHIDGSHLFRDVIHIAADSPASGSQEWAVRYGFDSRTPGRPGRMEAKRQIREDAPMFEIPIRSGTRPGIDATLELVPRLWNR
jgi:hypothetical protein